MTSTQEKILRYVTIRLKWKTALIPIAKGFGLFMNFRRGFVPKEAKVCLFFNVISSLHSLRMILYPFFCRSCAVTACVVYQIFVLLLRLAK